MANSILKPIDQYGAVRSRALIRFALLATFASFCLLLGDLMSGSIRAWARRHETLPTVAIENGRTVYCRMQACDFRFPLPDDAHVKQIGPVKGSFDVAEGVLYLEGEDGKPVDVLAYAKLLRRNRFEVEQSRWRVEAGSTGPKGGRITIETSDGVTKVHFDYFGDY